jgi:hypothetical protein
MNDKAEGLLRSAAAAEPGDCPHGNTAAFCELCAEPGTRATPTVGSFFTDKATGRDGICTAIQIGFGDSMQVDLERPGEPTGRWYPIERLVPGRSDQVAAAGPPEVQLSQHAEGDGRAMTPEAARAIAEWMTRARERIELLGGLLEETICSCTLAKRCPKHIAESTTWDDDV